MLTETADGFKRLKTPAALADEFSAVDLGAPLAGRGGEPWEPWRYSAD